MKIITIGLSLAALISISGCAGRVVHEGKFARDDGWYKGTVLQTGSADSLKRPAFYDCRKTDPMTSATQEYALIAFRRNGHPYARVAPVSGESGFNAGDRVYVNIRRCEEAITPRSS